MSTAKDEVRPYPITVEFERAIAALSSNQPSFFGRIGHEVEPEGLPTPAARLVFDACRAISADTGQGPDTRTALMQRLRRWREEGKVTHEDILAVGDLIDQAEDEVLPGIESAVAELRPILQQRMRYAAVRKAMDDYGAKKDLTDAVTLIERANAIGNNDVSVGVKYGTQVVDFIESLSRVDRLKYGVPPLDRELQGGLPRGQLGVFMGGPGDGKSMALSHALGRAMSNGLLCAYATLEVPTTTVYARIFANLFNLKINDIEFDPHQLKPLIENHPNFCPCFVKDFTPAVTTVDDLKAWVANVEEQMKRKVDVLVVDYADKMGAKPKKKGGKDEDRGMYQTMLDVYEALRVFAHQRQFWVLTATQSTGRGNKKDKEILDLSDTADSIHKVRVADQVITLNRRADGAEMIFFVAKNRTGPSGMRVGPVPCDMACGQVGPLVYDEMSEIAGTAGVPMGAPLLASEVTEQLFDFA